MSVKNLFIVDSVVCLLFGLSLIFSTQMLSKMFIVEPALTDGAIATFRSYGMFLVSAGISLISARNALPSAARRGSLIFISLSGTLITINTIHAILTGIDNNMAWGIAVITGIVGAWAIMLLLKEKVNEA